MLVLGIGNSLLKDEGAGIHVLRFMQRYFRIFPEVTYVDGGTLSFTLASEIENHASLLVLDAVELHAKPGTVCCHENEAMDDFLGSSKHSAHEVGLLDLLDIARLCGHLPQQRALVGIQYESFAWGEEPTPSVQASIPQAARLAACLLCKWQAARYPHAPELSKYQPEIQ